VSVSSTWMPQVPTTLVTSCIESLNIIIYSLWLEFKRWSFKKENYLKNVMSNPSSIPNPPSLVEYKNYKFLIFDAPTEQNIDLYLQEFKRYKVRHIARACEPSYETNKLSKEGIEVHELSFPDGGTPNEQIIISWLNLCKVAFKKEEETVGVHCVAGLGRAPLLVAIALIEMGLDYEEAVDLIRQKRRGAINAKQLKFLKSYVPHKKCTII